MQRLARSSHQTLRKHRRVLITALIGLGFTVGMAGSQDLPAEKVLPLALAVEAAQTALAACEQQGYRISGGPRQDQITPEMTEGCGVLQQDPQASGGRVGQGGPPVMP